MNENQEKKLREYAAAVVNASPSLHLTSDRDPELFWKRHILDAVQLLEVIPPEDSKKTMRALDIGSGNGVPGIPIAILRPEWHVFLLDSDSKKCGFIDMFCNISTIKNVAISHGRAENFARGPMRDTFDIVTARALSKLATALELSAAFIKPGGYLIVPHGTSWEAELKKTMRASELLGLTPFRQIPYNLGSGEFAFLIYKKTRATPDSYPRPVGIPSKRPLN